MDTEKTINDIAQLFAAVKGSDESTIITAIALLCALVTVLAAIKVLNLPPDKTPTWCKAVLFSFLAATVALAAAGPAVGLLVVPPDRPQPLPATPAAILANLRDNAQVFRLIRLIPYTPGVSDQLNVSNLQTLGPTDQQFTFVADYDELRGDLVSDAVKKVGGKLASGQHVSAIIFPLDQDIFPAGARGLLQVVQILDDAQPRQPGYQLFTDLGQLGRAELEDLANHQMSSWAWANYGPEFYGQYCRLAQHLRCSAGKFSALSEIGGVASDWDPLGFSFRVPPQAVCNDQEEHDQCAVKNWSDTDKYASRIGVRAFLMRNVRLPSLNNRVMIDFADPYQERIPYLPPPSEAGK